jgi:beta-aspartyl-peptidase (threonine type)
MESKTLKGVLMVVWVLAFSLSSSSQQLTTSSSHQLTSSSAHQLTSSSAHQPANWVIVVHGGAGGPGRDQLKPEVEKMYRDSLSKALDIGSAVLSSGGTSLDAVEAVIRFMEDCPIFNAGKGAVYNSDGIAELDASIMDGQTMQAGAVACVHTIKNPISAARKVMTNTPHVLLISEGAEAFAASQGLAIVDHSYFLTKERTDQYNEMKKKREEESKAPHGTVGCVALDTHGNLAAGTSTGGMMMKMKGRVGDTPIIGAGTYADNKTCAVSCTGKGEYFIRNSLAFQVSFRMACKGIGLEEAAGQVINDVLTPQGGTGGLIAVDKDGQIAMPFNTAAMYRGYRNSGGQGETAVFK